MKDIKDIKKKIEEQKSILEKEYKVKEIGIFGSYVRGEQKGKNDIDILVEFSQPVGLFTFLELEEHLTELIGIKVDLVSKKALKPRIGKNILKEIILV